MPGDYSRLTHQPNKHYSSVRMQQGRVQLDSDWNEQADIVRHALETAAQDLLGQAAALAEGHGFEITAESGSSTYPPRFTIGAGRFYVDGVVCTNLRSDPPLRAEAQPYYPPARSAARNDPEDRPETYLVYLDAWQEEVTAVEDPDLQEIALGGFDTAARLKTVWQVKFHPLAADRRQDTDKLTAASGDTAPSAVEPSSDTAAIPPNRLEPEFVPLPSAASELADDSGAAPALQLPPHSVTEIADRRAHQEAEVRSLRELAARLAVKPRPADETEVAEGWKGFLRDARNRGSLKALLPRPDIMTVENQLYRVEIHSVEAQGAASAAAVTFKWSRDNGSVAFAVTDIVEDGAAASESSRLAVTVRDLGNDPLALQPRDWVEIVDDTAVLRGQPLALLVVESVDWARKQVFLNLIERWNPDLLAEIKRGNPRLRRWDTKIPDGATSGAQATALRQVENGWLELENGLQVSFDPAGPYRPGDYWLIPTRLGQPLSWPDDNGSPKALPPHGPEHHYALLAVLRRDGDGWHAQDCRELYYTTTRLTERLDKLAARVEAEVVVLHKRISDEVELLNEQVDELTGRLGATQHELNQLRSLVLGDQDRITVLEGYIPDEKTRLFQDCITDVPLTVGDVVALDPNVHNHVIPANRANARHVYGVVHHLHEKGRHAQKKDSVVHVVIYGRTRAKVIGHVEPGDLLVPSHLDGCARKAGLGALLHPGTVLGKALGRHSGDDDEPAHIDVVVTLG